MPSDTRSSKYKPKVRGSEGLGSRLGIGTSEGSATFNELLLYVALFPALLLILLVEGLVPKNMSRDIALDQRGCVHGDTSIHHDVHHSRVPMSAWCEYLSSETDGRIASYTSL